MLLDELVALRLIRCTEPAARLGRRSRRWEISEEPTHSSSEGGKGATLAARKLTKAEVTAALDELQGKRRAKKGGFDPRIRDYGKRKSRSPLKTEIVRTAEPQIVPNMDEPTLCSHPGTANGHPEPDLRSHLKTSLISATHRVV